MIKPIGTAPVSGVGIIMLIIVLKSINVPEEGIALILGVDRFLDMCRTVPNITGDAMGSVIMAGQEAARAERITTLAKSSARPRFRLLCLSPIHAFIATPTGPPRMKRI